MHDELQPDFDLETFIPFRLNRVSERVSQDFAEVYRKAYGMTRPEWRTLANLGQHGRLTAREICDHSTQHKTKVSRAVASLEARKWLVRQRNPDDRREEFLALTDKGQVIYARLADLGRKQDGRLKESLGPEETKALLRALDALETMFGFSENRKDT